MSGTDPIRALQLAIESAGSASALGRMLGVSHTAVLNWSRGDVRLPAEHVLTIERELKVSRYYLRPDLYPRDDAPPPPAADLEPAR